MSNRIAYRTSTGQPDAAERETKREQRVQFISARNQALMTQRSQAQGRLTELRTDIANIHRAVMSGAELSDSEKVLAVLERKRVSEKKLVEEITRLTAKIR